MKITDLQKKAILNSLNQIIDLVKDTDYSKVEINENLYRYDIIDQIHGLYVFFSGFKEVSKLYGEIK